MRLQTLLASEPRCYGDGHLDQRVDFSDRFGISRYSGKPSVFDFNRDGVTTGDDVQCVSSNFGNDCRASGSGHACH